MSVLLALAITAAAGSQSTTFFEPCQAALPTPPFSALQAFYAAKPALPKPYACFRLNNREFLVTVTDAAPNAQGLYFFDARTGRYGFADGTARRGIGVKLEFDGPSAKHFALLQTSSLSGGEWSTAYEVLFLAPRSADRSFTLQKLIELKSDPESGLCGKSLSKGLAAELKTVQFITAPEELTLALLLDEQHCPSGPTRRVEKRFEWTGESFQAR